MAVSITVFLNEISVKYAQDKSACESGKILRKGRFEEIAKEVRTLRNISQSAPVNKRTIERCMQRGSTVVSQNHRGPPSPMTPHEDYFVVMMIKLNRCRIVSLPLRA